MTKTSVLFIQGGGEHAHREDSQLAESLQQSLGSPYGVRYPLMPHEAEPNVGLWKMAISRELWRLEGRIIVVAHSIGGSILLRYLSEEKVEKPIEGIFLLAAPSWDEDRWNFDDLRMPADLAEKLSAIAPVFLYHCRNDDVVPFAHLTLHSARIPQAVVRPLDSGGHQFSDGLEVVAEDIRANHAA
jgi:predicted alpha/beta hydrolase family esterase